MVIHVHIEGGVLPNKVDAQTMSRSNAFRESLNKFMQQLLNWPDLRIVIINGGGYKNAAKAFISRRDSLPSFLYCDLDRYPEEREQWFVDIERDGYPIPDADKNCVFFWVREMEAWFLKQPESIEQWASNEGYLVKMNAALPLSEHESIKEKDIEHLQNKPSIVIRGMISQTFRTQPKRGNKSKKVKYEKLGSAPGIILCLNPQKLVEKDIELAAFVNKVRSLLPEDA